MIKLQNERTVQKTCALDYNACMASASLTADARIVINRAWVECQSHWLTGEDPVTVEQYITSYIASLKQCYTQSKGQRPFDISALIVGFDLDGTSRLYQTDLLGTHYAWKVNSIIQAPRLGLGIKSVCEFLEKNYTDYLIIKAVPKALLEGVESGGQNI